MPALLAVGLGLWRLTTPALWADELATWGAVRLSWSQLWQLCGSVDVVLAPYYAAMKAYAAVAGTSTAALRLPSVLAVGGAALVVTALGRRAGGAGTGLIAGTLFAILPVTSRYAQEARPYALVMLFAALAALALIRLLELPSPARLAGYAGALALTGVFHPLSGLLVLGSHAVAVGVRQAIRPPDGWRGALRWAAAAALGSLPAIVLGVLGAGQLAQVSWIKRVGLDTFTLVPERLFLSAAVGGIVLGLALVAVRAEPAYVCLASAAFVPPVVLLAAGTHFHLWVARYALVALPALAVLAGAAATRFGRGPAAVVLLLTTALAYPANLAVRGEAGHGEASDRVATVIGANYRPGDVIVFPDTHPSIAWAPRDIYERYLRGPRPPDVLRTAPQRADGHLLATECPDASCIGSPPRIWVLRVDTSTDPFANMAAGKRARLSREYRTLLHWQYPLLTIYLLERRP